MLLRILRGKKDTKYILRLKKKRERREKKKAVYTHVHVKNSAKKVGAAYTCIGMCSLCG